MARAYIYRYVDDGDGGGTESEGAVDLTPKVIDPWPGLRGLIHGGFCPQHHRPLRGECTGTSLHTTSTSRRDPRELASEGSSATWNTRPRYGQSNTASFGDDSVHGVSSINELPATNENKEVSSTRSFSMSKDKLEDCIEAASSAILVFALSISISHFLGLHILSPLRLLRELAGSVKSLQMLPLFIYAVALHVSLLVAYRLIFNSSRMPDQLVARLSDADNEFRESSKASRLGGKCTFMKSKGPMSKQKLKNAVETMWMILAVILLSWGITSKLHIGGGLSTEG